LFCLFDESRNGKQQQKTSEAATQTETCSSKHYRIGVFWFLLLHFTAAIEQCYNEEPLYATFQLVALVCDTLGSRGPAGGLLAPASSTSGAQPHIWTFSPLHQVLPPRPHVLTSVSNRDFDAEFESVVQNWNFARVGFDFLVSAIFPPINR